MDLHPWWANFGQEVMTADQLTPLRARELASALAGGAMAGATLIGMKQSPDTGNAAVHFEIDVERPQDLAIAIKATEPVAAVFPRDGGPPCILALRADFPDTPHQNWTPAGTPCSLCIDDRPWTEAKLTATPADLLRRVQLWLAKAARGDLHDRAQPLDPLFFVSQLALVVPASALIESTEPVELLGFVRPDNPHLILTRPLQENTNPSPGFVVVALHAQPQTMGRLRHAPVTLPALAEEMERCGISLYDELKTRLRAWAGLKGDDIRRLSSRLAIVIAFPVTASEGRTANDLRAFITFNPAGEIGVALGTLHQNASQVGAKEAYVTAIPENVAIDRYLRIEPAQVHFTFDRELAASIAGHIMPDRRRAVLVGAGSLGSQVAVGLAREGAFSWTIVDHDYLLPHNLARHALFSNEVGAPKALALARQIAGLLHEPFVPLLCDVTNPDEGSREVLATRLTEAEIIIDASASVAVSRYLADMPDSGARRLCTFFNPAGTSVVLLVESADRSITLRDLEAQYHHLLVTESLLATHLQTEHEGVRYSGSCRALTNRIPAQRGCSARHQ
jgi:hypothetical protein